MLCIFLSRTIKDRKRHYTAPTSFPFLSDFQSLIRGHAQSIFIMSTEISTVYSQMIHRNSCCSNNVRFGLTPCCVTFQLPLSYNFLIHNTIFPFYFFWFLHLLNIFPLTAIRQRFIWYTSLQIFLTKNHFSAIPFSLYQKIYICMIFSLSLYVRMKREKKLLVLRTYFQKFIRIQRIRGPIMLTDKNPNDRF